MITDVMYPKVLTLVNHFNKLSNDYWAAKLSLAGQANIHLPGFCAFIMAESKERWCMSEDIAGFVMKNTRPVILEGVGKPKNNFNSPQQIVDYMVGLEQTTVNTVEGLINEAINAKDFNTESYLKWLYKWCLKEHKEVMDVSVSLKMYSGDAAALMMKDMELLVEYGDEG